MHFDDVQINTLTLVTFIQRFNSLNCRLSIKSVFEVAPYHRTLCIMTHHSTEVSEWDGRRLERAIL